MLFLIFILGLSVGSFLNVCVDRLSKGKSLLGRSQCDFCHKSLEPVDLIPVLSFFVQKGRCRYCHKKLSWYYPFMELLTGMVFLFLWIYLPYSIYVKSLYLFLFSTLIVIFFADVKYQIIPDEMQVAFLAASVALLVAQDGPFLWSALFRHLLEGAAVMAPMYLIYAFSKGRALGLGDVKFSFILGVFLGVLWGYIALYLGFVFGAVVGIYLLFAKKKKMKSKIAFGPFLVLGLTAVLFFSKQIMVILQFLRIR